MRIAFITRSTLFDDPGGDTVQITQTAEHLKKLGVFVEIFKTNEPIVYSSYDLLHFFNLTRPADILYHIKKSKKPFVVSPILVDYHEYDKQHRKGISGLLFRHFSSNGIEYIKTVARWLTGKDILQSKNYLWKGQTQSIKCILKNAASILPNSKKEYDKLNKLYPLDKPLIVVPNGVDEQIFKPDPSIIKDKKLILCAARIEGLKNQLNLITALNKTDYKLVLAGNASPNQQKYYRRCRKIAAENIHFTGNLTHEELLQYYKIANVHVLPSWFETCGLSSLEAAAMGCNIVITDKGFTRDYYGNHAFYCDPGDPNSILNAIEKAANSNPPVLFQDTIATQYTWKQAALTTKEAYKKILSL